MKVAPIYISEAASFMGKISGRSFYWLSTACWCCSNICHRMRTGLVKSFSLPAVGEVCDPPAAGRETHGTCLHVVTELIGASSSRPLLRKRQSALAGGLSALPSSALTLTQTLACVKEQGSTCSSWPWSSRDLGRMCGEVAGFDISREIELIFLY